MNNKQGVKITANQMKQEQLKREQGIKLTQQQMNELKRKINEVYGKYPTKDKLDIYSMYPSLTDISKEDSK